MSFEFKQMEIETDFTKTHKIVYGEAGTGKTTFAAAMESPDKRKPYFLFTEKGQGTLHIWGQQVTGWDGFLRMRDIILGPKKEEFLQKFGCLVLDVAGELDEMCARYVASQNKVATIGLIPHGNGYPLHENAFKDGIKDLLNLTAMIFTTHVQDKEFLWNGEMVKALVPRFSKRILYYLNGKADFIMYMQAANSKKEERIITMKPELGRVAKARYPHMNKAFTNFEGDAPRTWRMMQDAFKTTPVPPTAEEHPALQGGT